MRDAIIYVAIFLAVVGIIARTQIKGQRTSYVCDYFAKMNSVGSELDKFDKQLRHVGGWTTRNGIEQNVEWLESMVKQLKEMQDQFEDETEDILQGNLYDVHYIVLDMFDSRIELGKMAVASIKQQIIQNPYDTTLHSSVDALNEFLEEFEQDKEELVETLSKINVQKYRSCPQQPIVFQ